MARLGMDPDAVERSAANLEAQADRLTLLTTQTGRSITRLNSLWYGTDAEHLIHGRWPQERATLTNSQTTLREMARILRQNVAEQRQASASSPGASMTSSHTTYLSQPAVAPLLDRPGSPTQTSDPHALARWWDALEDDEQRALIATRPDLIGAADGLPSHVRSEANEIQLKRDLDLDPSDPRYLNAKKTDEALQQVRERLGDTRDPKTGLPVQPYLLDYHPGAYGGDGAVAISVGNPDTADNVTAWVPGLNTVMDGAPNDVGRAHNLFDAARSADSSQSTAVVYWLGYDTPSDLTDVNDGLRVAGTAKANAGGEQFAQFMGGLGAARTDGPAHVTAIGHSYGSTTVAFAAAAHDMKVHDVVLIGSPGAGPALHASQLGADRVWVGEDWRDVVGDFGQASRAVMPSIGHQLGPQFGPLGVDPSQPQFGGIQFRANSPIRPSDGFFTPHEQYFEGEPLENMGRISVGQSGSVTREMWNPFD